jgi:lysozyme family protein
MASKDFAKSLQLVLVHEGGYSNDPRDPGGATMKGVTQRVYDMYRKAKGLTPRSVKSITRDELQDIYKSRYWDMIKGDQLPAGVDYVCFDGAVNSGPVQAGKWLQKALGSHYIGKIDGQVGASTVAAALDHPNHDALVEAICARRLAFLRALKTWRVFGKGWQARVDDVERIGKEWATGAQPASLKASFYEGGNASAPLESASGKPWNGPADAVTGAGGITTMISQATDQLTPYADQIEFIGKIVAYMTVTGVVLMIGGLGWRAFANWRREKRADALNLDPVH